MQHLSGPLHDPYPRPWWATWRRYHCWCGLRRCPDLVIRHRERVLAELAKHWDERQW